LILHGDCLEKLSLLADNSVDAVVTDPPYGLKFMGKRWDYDVPSIEMWRECLRVLKPGGHLLSFGGTRTYHRMVLAIEDAGFEIRDQIMWLYGSGFPKSHSIDKAIDKMHGAEREVVGISPNNRDRSTHTYNSVGDVGSNATITAPATPDAIKWQGWGTALKPANEPIVLARKPLDASCTIAENVLKWGVGGLNIDASRIETDWANDPNKRGYQGTNYVGGNPFAKDQHDDAKAIKREMPSQGRWPANVILSCACDTDIHDQLCAVHLLDEQSGERPSRGTYLNRKERYEVDGVTYKFGGNVENTYAGQTGGASRFFYVAKASKRERNHGCEGMEERVMPPDGPLAWGVHNQTGKPNKPPEPQKNNHPTVKPIRLMAYLIKLITPHGGTVLDPFMGSGSTGVAARKLGCEFIGIEMNEEYVAIAERRIQAYEPPIGTEPSMSPKELDDDYAEVWREDK
jgi:DNA modification methylase